MKYRIGLILAVLALIGVIWWTVTTLSKMDFGATPTAPTAAATESPTEATQPSSPAGTVEIKVMTHDSFAASEEVIKAFEAENNAKVTIIPSGDAGSMLNKAILSKNAPLADVLYGVDNTFLSRALNEEIFVAYESPELANVDAAFKLDSANRVTPIDFGDVCINYDKKYFADKNLAVPATLDDLTKPEYKGLLAVENPATSSPGLAFMLATVAKYGPEGWTDYWTKLKDNGVVVVTDWNTAYYTNFSGSSGKGPQPMIVSYASSPAAEVIFAETPLTEAPTASIIGPGTCFRQVEFAGILKGTKNQEMAQKFIDFLLSVKFQEDIPMQMFVYPVNKNAVLPEEFTKYAQTPAEVGTVDAATIEQNRDKWIAHWTDTVLK